MEHIKWRRKGRREAATETSIERERLRRRRWVATSSNDDEESASSIWSMLMLVKGERVVVVGGGRRPSICRRLVKTTINPRMKYETTGLLRNTGRHLLSG